MKICSECEHFKGDQAQVYMAQLNNSRPQPECTHPDAKTRDPIYGKCFCQNERNMGKCGKSGKLWEPRKRTDR